MKIVSRDRWFEVRSLSDGIRLIHEPYIRPFYRCNLWHIQGRDRDLLLDSGSGLVSLREQLPWLTERPLLAVASHCHFDHIAGHHEFPERLVHPAEAQILAAPDGANTLSAAYVGDEMFEAHPDCPLCYAEYRVKAAPATRLIEEGDVLDLGNRSLQVLHTPGHSPGGSASGRQPAAPCSAATSSTTARWSKTPTTPTWRTTPPAWNACTSCRCVPCTVAISAVFRGRSCAR